MMNQWNKAAFLALAAPLFAASMAAGAADLRSLENVAKIRVGTTTVKEVQDLLGEPNSTRRDSRRGWNALEYRVFMYGESSVLWVSVSQDGVVREVIQLAQKRSSGSV